MGGDDGFVGPMSSPPPFPPLQVDALSKAAPAPAEHQGKGASELTGLVGALRKPLADQHEGPGAAAEWGALRPAAGQR